MGQFQYEIVKNPEIFMQNRLPAHSDHEFSSTKGTRVSLNGTWKFAYGKNYKACDSHFMDADYSCREWADIRVPGHIQLQGYDRIMYVNSQYPWDGHEAVIPGEIPVEYNPTACYVKYFMVPEAFGDGPVYISFQGVESGFALWLNGQYVGYSEDSFTPSEFDLTPYLIAGENKLAVQVFKFTAGSWCEDQDFFRFSGIFREVYLYTIPQTHIRDLRIQTILDERFENAKLVLDIDSTGDGSVNCNLARCSRNTAGYDSLQQKNATGNEELTLEFALTMGRNHIELSVEKPLLWSAEKPNLYDLTLQVYREGELMETVMEAVGFRSFAIVDHVMQINGKRVVFKGVNRHEFSSRTGRCLSVEEIEKDLITMKRNNINAIRCSHYPNQTAFYRLCDQYGLYVIDETNLETHGTWQLPIQILGLREQSYAVPGDRPEYTQNVLDRAHSMFERDKNHPCVVMWSLGNESYGGLNLQKMHDAFHEWDTTRPVHYEGIFNDRRYPNTSDVESTMYVPAAEIRDYLKSNREKPYINCEYMHAMGNSCGAMDKYTELAYEEPLFQGGFIWDYIDQAITKKDRYGHEFEGYGGDFDDRPHDGSFSGDGICYSKDRSPSPKMQEVKNLYQSLRIDFTDEQIHIENRNLFTDAAEYDAVMTVERLGQVVYEEHMTIACPPLSEQTIPLELELPAGEEYVITLSFCTKEDTIWAKAGHEVAFGQHVVGSYEIPRTEGQKLRVTQGFENIGVKGDDFEVLFSNTAGGLASYVYHGTEYLKKTVRANFWRPMTENDLANQLPFRAGAWKLASRYWGTRAMDAGLGSMPILEQSEDFVTVTYTYYLATKPLQQCTVRYTVHGDGLIGVELTMPPSEQVGELPEFSMFFTLDADLENLEWYGMGPEETYPDKRHGRLGVYHNQVKDNMAKYLVPQECGNKEEVRYAKLTKNNGEGLVFYANGLGLSALPYQPDEIDSATHPQELPPIHYTYVRVGRQMGVAGDDTWGAKTHPEYMIDNSKKLQISMAFRGI